MNSIKLCVCVGLEVVELERLMRPMSADAIKAYCSKHLDYLDEQTRNGLVDIILHGPKDLTVAGRSLIFKCIDFLLINVNRETLCSLKADRAQFHTEKYVTIWSFVYNFLKIRRDSGFDYFLLSYLDYYKLMDHGGGIRCAWYNDVDLEDRVKQCGQEVADHIEKIKHEDVDAISNLHAFQEKLKKWTSEAPDDL
jgi:hypothetical protein